MSNTRCASIFAFSTALIAAGCSGITIDIAGTACESPAIAADSSTKDRYLAARPVSAGTLTMNEAKDSITLVMKVVGGCEKHDDEFVWNPDFYYGDSATFGYRFSGDTLFLSTRSVVEKGFEDPEEMLVERILIGDGNDGFDGIWLMSPCSYVGGILSCREYAYEEYMLIDGNDVEQRALDKMNADYMESVFVDELFRYIGSRSSALQLETVFYGADIEGAAKSNGIEIDSKSHTAMTFTYADLEFSVALIYAGLKDSVQVVVKSGNTECVGTHREMLTMTSEECRVDYADKLREEDSGAWTFWSQNSDEFARCIDGILGRESE